MTCSVLTTDSYSKVRRRIFRHRCMFLDQRSVGVNRWRPFKVLQPLLILVLQIKTKRENYSNIKGIPDPKRYHPLPHTKLLASQAGRQQYRAVCRPDCEHMKFVCSTFSVGEHWDRGRRILSALSGGQFFGGRIIFMHINHSLHDEANQHFRTNRLNLERGL